MIIKLLIIIIIIGFIAVSNNPVSIFLRNQYYEIKSMVYSEETSAETIEF